MVKLLALAACVLFVWCTGAPLTGGTGTDIGEARVYGVARLPGYVAGEKVRVVLRRQDYLPQSTPPQNQLQAVSGDDGKFALSPVVPGYYLVELDDKDTLGAIRRFYVSPGDSAVYLGNVLLDTLELFTGRVLIDDTSASGAALLVLGTDTRVPIAGDGTFAVHLPPGDQLFRIVAGNDAGSADVIFGSANSGDTIRVGRTTATLLDDFENDDGYNNLSALLGGGGWFAYSDQSGGGNSRVLPTMVAGLAPAIDTTSDAFRGGSLHCIFEIDTLFSAPYALIGVDICSSKDAGGSMSWFDLSKATALTFMAKGEGTVYVQFTCRPVDTSSGFLVYEVPVTLSAAWTGCTIRTSDLPEALSSTSSRPLPWSRGKTAVSNINFLAKKKADLWLDNLTIEGMSPSDFLTN
jgi:hypothetical protein